MAPVAFKLAKTRTTLLPASSDTLLDPMRLPSAMSSTEPWRSFRGTDDEIDGELLSRKRDRRSECRFDAQQRLRATRERERIDGNVQFARKPGGARDASLILVAVGDESDTRRHAAGQTGNRVSDRRFDIRAAAGIAGAVLQRPIRCVRSDASTSREDRPNGMTRSQ